MGFDDGKKSEYVVVDTSAFIRNTNLQDFAEKIITIQEVINEIRSKRQLRRLVVLPYDLQIKEATSENIKHVIEFSKKTGDYPSLSATDIKVIALTYQLEVENVGVDHLRSIPEIKRSVNYCESSLITAKDTAGFYLPKKNSKNFKSSETDSFNDESEKLEHMLGDCSISKDDPEEYLSACSDSSGSEEYFDPATGIDEKFPSESNIEKSAEEIVIKNPVEEFDEDRNFVDTSDDCNELYDDFQNMCVMNEMFNKVVNREDETSQTNEEELYSEEDSDDNDESDWISPYNIQQIKREMDAENLDDKPVKVACLTMDFAMQNVLKQMGLNVISLDGRVIKQMRTFILRCYACYKTTSVMTKVFCHHCGNKTLKKVAVSLDADGNQKIHINLRRPLTARGKKYSLPKPTGGKHSNYPILFEDQRVPQQRPTRLANTKTNPLDPDYIAGYSPFVMRDVNSRSAVLGIPNRVKEFKYWMQRNPNESSGKRRKKK